MKKVIFSVILILFVYACAMSQTISFSGNTHAVMILTPEKNTGLDKIYVLYDTDGVSMSFEASDAYSPVKWYKYGTLGGGYAEEITEISQSGTITTLPQVIPNSGYIIEVGDIRKYIWIVDYSDYYLSLDGIEPDVNQDCGSISLNVSGSGVDINYTTINGVAKKLSREIKLRYSTLEWDSEGQQWNQIEVTEEYEGFKPSIYERAPLCNTTFVLSGDKFLEYWGEGVEVVSSSYTAHSIDVQTTAEQIRREIPNEKTESDETTLGGSAPVDVTFSAYPTDAVAQREWQMSSDPEFGTIESSYTEDVLQETFTEVGTFYVRYVARNADGSCEVVGETYTVSIGESVLICPNAFSPQATPGVNDEWRVQYKSIISFKCWIFNRWGVQICELNDPSQGWDGKYKGKYVGSGTYYYVIKAKGADGKNYNLKGDINIINYKGNETTGNNNGEGVIE